MGSLPHQRLTGMVDLNPPQLNISIQSANTDYFSAEVHLYNSLFGRRVTGWPQDDKPASR